MEPEKTEVLIESEHGLIAIENVDADICTICGSEYLPAESDNYIEMTVEKILDKKVSALREAVFRVALEA